MVHAYTVDCRQKNKKKLDFCVLLTIIVAVKEFDGFHATSCLHNVQ